MYGTCEAGKIWEDTYRDAREAMGFLSGKASPSIFYHPMHDIATGNDFTALGMEKEINWLKGKMQEVYEIKDKGTMGHDEHDVKTVRV